MNAEDVANDIAKRCGLLPFGFDSEKADMLYKQKEKELQARINQAYLDYHDDKKKMLYSRIPDKYKSMKFADLTKTASNEQMIKHCSQYVKNYSRHRKGFGIIGDMGVGKTTLMAITGVQLIKKYEQSVYFSTEEALLDEIRKSYDDDSYDSPEDVVRRIGEHDVVMIDELGQSTSNWSVLTIKRVIDTVINNNGKIFITTNYNSEELMKRWGYSKENKSPMQVIDRLFEVTDFYTMKGTSIRRLVSKGAKNEQGSFDW